MRFNRSNFLLERTRSKRRTRNLINNASLIIVHRATSERLCNITAFPSSTIIGVGLSEWQSYATSAAATLCRVYISIRHTNPYSLPSPYSHSECALSILCLLYDFFSHSFYNRGVFSPNFIIISRHYILKTPMYTWRYTWLNNYLSVGTRAHTIIITLLYYLFNNRTNTMPQYL